MQIIFLANFLVAMLQIWIGERSYSHLTAMFPAVCLGLLFGSFVAMLHGFILGLMVGGYCCLIRYAITQMRFVIMTWQGVEWGSECYYRAFAVGCVVETGTLFFLTYKLNGNV